MGQTMRLARDPGHDPSCTGCPACDPAMARVLSASPAELGAILRERDRETGKSGHVLKAATGPTGATSGEEAPAIPDAYGLAALAKPAEKLNEHDERIALAEAVAIVEDAAPDGYASVAELRERLRAAGGAR